MLLESLFCPVQTMSSLFRPLLCLLLLCHCVASNARPTLTLSCMLPKEQPAFTLLQQLLSQAFEPLGYEVQLVDLPTDQVITQLRSGLLDGDCGRALTFDQVANLELVKVETPLRNTSLSPWALANRSDVIQKPRNVLRAAYYAPGLVLAGMVSQLGYVETVPVTNTSAGFSLLDQGRVDLFYGYDFAVAHYLEQQRDHRYQNLGATAIVPVHLFLHPRHASLAGPLASQLARGLTQTPMPVVAVQPTDVQLKPFRMVCVAELETDEFPMIERYFRAMFAQLGYRLSLSYEPPRRAAASLRRKHYDGLCGAIANFNQLWDMTLLRVATPVAHLSLQVWSTDPAWQLQSPQQFAGLRLAFVRGSPIITALLKGVNYQSLAEVPNTETGLKMLAARRVDVFLGVDFFVQHSLSRLALSEALYAAGTLLRFEAYPYVQPEFEALIQPLEQLIQARGPL